MANSMGGGGHAMRGLSACRGAGGGRLPVGGEGTGAYLVLERREG